ncbi:MAG: aminotransferase class IV [Flavisolibacter sp.]
MNFVCFNGDIVVDQPLFFAHNRSFKYGDGIFETIKVYKGKILLSNLHFERLFSSLQLLKIKHAFNELYLSEKIIELCKKNDCSNLARVRLAVYREEEGTAGFVMEALPLINGVNSWNKKGMAIDLYPYARKPKDAFSNLKTANFLPYVLASLYAKENNLDDSIVLNSDNHICDSSKANIFLIKNGEIFTPALHQGCVNGVMRRFLIDEVKKLNYKVHQQEITEDDLLNADEVFLSNAIIGMHWVGFFRKKNYVHNVSSVIYGQLLSLIYQ